MAQGSKTSTGKVEQPARKKAAQAGTQATARRRDGQIGARRSDSVPVRRGSTPAPRAQGELPRRTEFLVGVLGNKRTAELLKVAESQPSRWRRSEELPGPRVAPLLVDLDHVVGRLILVWDESLVADWLTSSNAFLEGARPIDVIATRGTSEVVEAIEAEAAGTFA
jgi:hypothetical protein